jgi:hypothetical protein
MIAVQTASRLSKRFESFVKTLDGFESIDALLRGADQRKTSGQTTRHVVILAIAISAMMSSFPQQVQYSCCAEEPDEIPLPSGYPYP